MRCPRAVRYTSRCRGFGGFGGFGRAGAARAGRRPVAAALALLVALGAIGSTAVQAPADTHARVLVLYAEGQVAAVTERPGASGASGPSAATTERSELAIGDELPLAATVTVGAGALLELDDGTAQVFLARAGSYALADLFGDRQRSRRPLSAIVGAKLTGIVAGRDRGPSAALGVRGEPQSGGDLLSGDDDAALLRAARDLIEAGDLDEAIALLDEGIELAFDDQIRAEMRFRRAATRASRGERGPALRELQQLQPRASAPYYVEFVLVSSQLLVDGGDYQAAVARLHPLTAPLLELTGTSADRSTPSWLQAALVLQAGALAGTGARTAAAALLERAIALDPDSDWGRRAAALYPGAHGS